MKKIGLLLALLMGFALFYTAAHAETADTGTCGAALSWTLEDDGTLTVTGTGPMTNFTAGNSPWNAHADEIKAAVLDTGVTTVGAYAFADCTALKDLSLPATLTAIRNNAFAGCTALESLTLPEKLNRIGQYAFSGCAALGFIDVSPALQTAEAWAFYECTGLKRVNVTDLAAWCNTDFGNDRANPAYYAECLYLNGKKITDLKLPKGVTEIKSYTFYNNKALTAASVPDSATAIRDYAFTGCTALGTLNAEDLAAWCGITLETYAFPFGETELYIEGAPVTELTVPAGVTEIKDRVFANCDKLTAVSLPEGLTAIGRNAFSDCTALTAVTLPESVTSVGAYAFYNDTSLQTLNIMNRSAVLNLGAFEGCTGLTDGMLGSALTWTFADGTLTLTGEGKMRDFGATCAPWYALAGKTETLAVEGLARIGKNAFVQFAAKEIRIPQPLTESGEDAFLHCTGVERVVIEDLAAWCGIQFKNAAANPLNHGAALYLGEAPVTALTVPDGVTAISAYAFYGCTGITSVSLPESVKTVGANAFGNNTALTRVSYRNPETKIASNAFAGCALLSGGEVAGVAWSLNEETGTLTLTGEGEMPAFSETAAPPWKDRRSAVRRAVVGKGLTNVSTYAFDGCVNLESFELPGSVTAIGAYAFRGCSALQKASVGENVTEIGNGAFAGCNSLTEITVPFIGANADTGADKRIRPFGHIFGWTMSSAGRNEAHQSVYNGIEDDEEPAFSAYYGVPDTLKKVTVTGGHIRRGAFENCKHIETVVLADGAGGIGREAFACCSALKDVRLPESVTQIGASAFDGCVSLAAITLPESVHAVGARAFNDCEALTAVRVPPRVTMIEDETFRLCGALTSVTLGCGVRYVGTDAFFGCTALSELRFGGSEAGWNEAEIAEGNDLLPAPRCTDDAHVYIRDERIVPATCTEDGYFEEMTCCEYCGAVIDSVKDPIKTTGHLMSIPERLPAEAPDQLYILRRVCRRCGYVEDTPVYKNNGVRGDVDGSGKTTSADARLALRAAVKLETLTPEQFAAADVNGDGSVRADDARTILRIAVKLEN